MVVEFSHTAAVGGDTLVYNIYINTNMLEFYIQKGGGGL